MLRLFRNKFFLGGVCLLVAGVLAFGLLPRLYADRAATAEVIQLLETVERGTAITEEMVRVTEVGAYGLPEEIIREKSELAGCVAKETMYAGEYLWRQRIISALEFDGNTSKSGYALTEGMCLLTIRLPSESAGIAGVLRAGDTVDVYGYADQGESTSSTVALSAIRISEVLNSKLMPLDALDAELAAHPDKRTSDYDFAPAFIVFYVDEYQASVLIGLEKDKALHLALRGMEAQP